MPILDTEKRPKGLKALSAFKPNGLKKKSPDPPSPQDDPVDVPDFLTADTLPPIPGQADKQLPQPPAPQLNNFARREAPVQVPVPQPVSPVSSPPPPSSMNTTMNMRPRNGMPMDTMRLNTVPVPRNYPPTSPPPSAPAGVGVHPANMKPMRNPAMSMNQVPHGDVHTATVPHAPKPIRPPSIPVVDRIPSITRSPPPPSNGTISPKDEVPSLNGFIAEDKDTTGNATPVATNHVGKARDPAAEEAEEEEEEEEARPETATPLIPADVPAIAAPLNDMHFNCYQDHRAMRMANNIWYPVPCMACQKHDQEIRYRCVFCCLRVCNGCFQVLQRCQRRSLRKLLEGIESHSSRSSQS